MNGEQLSFNFTKQPVSFTLMQPPTNFCISCGKAVITFCADGKVEISKTTTPANELAREFLKVLQQNGWIKLLNDSPTNSD